MASSSRTFLKIHGQLRDADRPQHREVLVEIAGAQCFDFRERPLIDHPDEALIAARIKPVSRWRENDRADLDLAGNAAGLLLLPLGERAAGRDDHLERSADPRRIARPEARGSLGIQRLELTIVFLMREERTRARTPGSMDGTGAIPSRSVRNTARSRRRGWASALLVNVGILLGRHSGPVVRRAGEAAVHHAIEPVLGDAYLFGRWRCAEDRNVPVDLCTIGVDDDAVDLLSKRQGQCRLAARGRSGNEDKWRF